MDADLDERKRGRSLTFWLILIAVLYAFLAYTALATLLAPAQQPDPGLTAAPQWVLLLLLVLSVVNLGAIIALWRWRKVGFHLFLVTAIPLIGVNLLVGVQPLMALFPLYSLSTFWLLLQARWKSFH